MRTRAKEETYAEEHGHEGQAVLRALGEDFGRLPPECEAVQDTRRAEEETVAGGERAGEDACVDDRRKDCRRATESTDQWMSRA